MADICVKEVIISTLTVKGDGKPWNPYRQVLQVFEKNGELIAERDTSPFVNFQRLDMINFAAWCVRGNIQSPNHSDIVDYLDAIKDPRH